MLELSRETANIKWNVYYHGCTHIFLHKKGKKPKINSMEPMFKWAQLWKLSTIRVITSVFGCAITYDLFCVYMFSARFGLHSLQNSWLYTELKIAPNVQMCFALKWAICELNRCIFSNRITECIQYHLLAHVISFEQYLQKWWNPLKYDLTHLTGEYWNENKKNK